MTFFILHLYVATAETRSSASDAPEVSSHPHHLNELQAAYTDHASSTASATLYITVHVHVGARLGASCHSWKHEC